eukprot:403340088
MKTQPSALKFGFNKTLFLGCIGHIATHYTSFILMFTLTQHYQFQYPFYVLIWMSLLMFVIGGVYGVRQVWKAWNVSQNIFPLGIASLFQLFIFHSFEWVFMIFSLKIENALPVLNYVTFSTATDLMFVLALSRKFLGLFGVICCEFLVYNGNKNKELSSDNFMLEPSLTSDQTYSYIFCLLSRFCHSYACVLHKKALLKSAAFERYKTFKLSAFRRVKVNDLNDEGDISKPVVSERSALFNKAKFILNERKLLAQQPKASYQSVMTEILRPQGFFSKSSSRKAKIQDEQFLMKILREQQIVENTKIERNRGLTKRQGKVLTEKNQQLMQEKLRLQEEYEKNRVQNLNIQDFQDTIKNKHNQLSLHKRNGPINTNIEQNSKWDEAQRINQQLEELDRQMEDKKRWAMQMSEEMQELIKDYKFYQLHEHLFDGQDDIWLTKLDFIFDSSALDGELFGIETPSHFALMSVIGGFMSVPLFLIMHLLSGATQMKSFMGMVESANNSSFNFYQDMFNGRWQSILIMIALCVLYTIKPLATTNFVLSINNTLTYVTVDIIAKILFIFLTMIAADNKAFVSSMEAIGLMLVLLAQHMYYSCSDVFKDQMQIKSATDALKCAFEYESIHDLQNIERKLDQIQESFSCVNVMRILYDTILARDLKQLDFMQLSSSLLHKRFDTNFYKTSQFWGGGYPRPSLEHMTQSHIVRGEDAYNLTKEELRESYIRVNGRDIYDFETYEAARDEWAIIEDEREQYEAENFQVDHGDIEEFMEQDNRLKSKRDKFEDQESKPLKSTRSKQGQGQSESQDNTMTMQQLLLNDSQDSDSSTSQNRQNIHDQSDSDDSQLEEDAMEELKMEREDYDQFEFETDEQKRKKQAKIDKEKLKKSIKQTLKISTQNSKENIDENQDNDSKNSQNKNEKFNHAKHHDYSQHIQNVSNLQEMRQEHVQDIEESDGAADSQQFMNLSKNKTTNNLQSQRAKTMIQADQSPLRQHKKQQSMLAEAIVNQIDNNTFDDYMKDKDAEYTHNEIRFKKRTGTSKKRKTMKTGGLKKTKKQQNDTLQPNNQVQSPNTNNLPKLGVSNRKGSVWIEDIDENAHNAFGNGGRNNDQDDDEENQELEFHKIKE